MVSAILKQALQVWVEDHLTFIPPFPAKRDTVRVIYDSCTEIDSNQSYHFNVNIETVKGNIMLR